MATVRKLISVLETFPPESTVLLSSIGLDGRKVKGELLVVSFDTVKKVVLLKSYPELEPTPMKEEHSK
jgi:hypothetical protein